MSDEIDNEGRNWDDVNDETSPSVLTHYRETIEGLFGMVLGHAEIAGAHHVRHTIRTGRKPPRRIDFEATRTMMRELQENAGKPLALSVRFHGTGDIEVDLVFEVGVEMVNDGEVEP